MMMQTGKSNCFISYNKLEPFSKLATSYGLRGLPCACPLSWSHRIRTLAQGHTSVGSAVYGEGDDHAISARQRGSTRCPHGSAGGSLLLPAAGASRVCARLWGAAPVGRIRPVWGRGVCSRGNGRERCRFSVASSPRVAPPRDREWTPRGCAASRRVAPHGGVCGTPGISGYGGSQSCPCPSRVMH